MKPVALISCIALIALATPVRVHAGNPSEVWSQHCVRCHGSDGKGQTKMGRKLRIKDLTSETQRTRLTEQRIMETITEGKQDATGNERMPSFREKLSPDEQRSLANFVRSLSSQTSISNSD